LAARLHDASVGDEPTDAARAAEPRGALQRPRLAERHKAKRSPRAIRFELTPGKPVNLVLEPWEQRIVLHSTPYAGPRAEFIRTWGRDRLRVLARLLPLAEHAEVYLLGTGLPSFWVVHMGDMRLTLGLSGWTANDWTSGGSALDQIAPPAEPSDDLLADIAVTFQETPTQTFSQICAKTGGAAPFVAAGSIAWPCSANLSTTCPRASIAGDGSCP